MYCSTFVIFVVSKWQMEIKKENNDEDRPRRVYRIKISGN